MRNSRWTNLIFQLIAVILALGFTTLVMLIAKAPPLDAFKNIIIGSIGSWTKISDVLISWTPLLLATTGLLITFTAGLWNIGIEGQMMIGAVFSTWVLRLLQESTLPPALILGLAILGGMLGGALWALLTGVLKTFGGVNEIFGGLGLNFVATSINLWLIFGPWKRPGVASMSGTIPFPETLWLPTLPGSRLSLWALGLALISIVLVYFLLRGTYFGLRLKAVGKNAKAAYLLGVPTWQYSLAAFALCGIFAGLAGAMQVLVVYHRLIPSISSGYGYLGLMVAMLVNYQALWAAPVAFFFAALNIGSIQLPVVLKLDSTLSGVLQGTLVLFVLLMQGARQKLGIRN
ncbi:MAG: ABC transporter permease [Anaerolineae bacterium CG_4_9_14_3_um_filter_57_17]|nr:ABC transporter permease [bacterium]NCT21007.1 ABC transporter permease [bacterium]OIO83293.1 MAG: sugar ABC transporter permease [Anaerolineae bacterium CG2_30_57_67]PJB68364.1 MAG: ABC transporter permease [Anaerolineae bacterium CG_4_9_14_3_um_filter_57_17]